MALRALMLRKKIDDKKKELEALRGKDAELDAREAELEMAINEAQTDDERQAVEEAVTAFESDKQTHDDAMAELERVVGELETELAEQENNHTKSQQNTKPEAGGKDERAIMRQKFFNMTIQERDALFARDDVKQWLGHVRTLQNRAVTGANLLIPEVVLPLVYSATEEYSKLLKHVDVVDIPGTARQTIMGEIPEAIWTEMCANLNEVGLSFTAVELDGFKVGAFIPVCNAILEDSDINLASEIIYALGQGIGYAIDKAIVYGTGSKMPTGFAGKIPAGSRVNLGGAEDVKLFKAIVKGTKTLKHATGEKVWVMSEATKADLIANALTVNAAGVITSAVDNSLPIIGGVIETLDFIPDGEFLGGYMKRYKLGRRAGISVAQSTEYRFLQDQTVFKATARYDGKPVFDDAFIAFGLTAAPTVNLDASHPFPTDAANATDGD